MRIFNILQNVVKSLLSAGAHLLRRKQLSEKGKQ